MAGVTNQYKGSEEADDANWITGIEEVRFHSRFQHFHHFEDLSRQFFVVSNGVIIKMMRTVIYRSAIVKHYSLETRYGLFRL